MIDFTSQKETQSKLHVMRLYHHNTPKLSHSCPVTEENLPEGNAFCPSSELTTTGNVGTLGSKVTPELG